MDDQLMRALLDQAPDAVIFAGKGGLVAYWNSAAERIFGFPAGEAIGRSLDLIISPELIIPEQYREAHWEGFERALEAGDTKYRRQVLATRAVRADGETIYVELSLGIVKNGEGTVIGAMAMAHDITERFIRERDMQRKLLELEQKAG